MAYHEEPWWTQTEVARLRGYTMTYVPHGCIFWGKIPVNTLKSWVETFCKENPDAVMDFDLPNYYKATMVVCNNNESADAWRSEINMVLDRTYSDDPARRWFYGLDTGLSSKCIWKHMMGNMNHGEEVCVPRDSDDFGRCYRLLKIMGEWRDKIHEMNEYEPWKNIVYRWDKLENLYESKDYQTLNAELDKANSQVG